jgi:excisionase family DNA binding protein
MTDEILTLPEVAQLLEIADKTLHRMAGKGNLPVLKVGGQRRLRRTNLDFWIDAKTCCAAGEEKSE